MKLFYTEIISKIEESNIPTERIVKFACDCALVNIEMIEPYTNDGEYPTITDFLKRPVSDAADATNAAADDAAYYAAYYAAAASTRAADDGYAADDAYYAARAAYYAADAADAAGDAAGDAAYVVSFAADAAHAAGNSDKVEKLIDELFKEFE